MRMIHVLRKPLSEGTVAANTLKHGCGGLNIDASRIGTTDNLDGGAYSEGGSERWDGAENWRYKRGEHGNAGNFQQPTGRWPANLILQHLDGCRCEGTTKIRAITGTRAGRHESRGWGMRGTGQPTGHGDADGKETVANWACVEGCPVAALKEPSRFFTQTRWDPIYDVPFFYCAKAAKKEREAGCAGLAPEKQDPIRQAGDPGGDNPRNRGAKKRLNNHPTVKPVGIMRWLVRLVTPPGGVVLDPFAGSGTTLIACCLEGFDSIGIEQDTHYIEIAEKRIAHWQENRGA